MITWHCEEFCGCFSYSEFTISRALRRVICTWRSH